MPREVTKGVYGKRYRFVAEFVFSKVFVCQFSDRPNALVALVCNPVKTLFKLCRRFCSAIRASVFNGVLAGSRMRLPANVKSYHHIADLVCFPVLGSLYVG